jgi:hypothetical protein
LNPGSASTGSGDLGHHADSAGRAPDSLCDGTHSAEKNALRASRGTRPAQLALSHPLGVAANK